jgi:alpha-1,2-mannosyltransferase
MLRAMMDWLKPSFAFVSRAFRSAAWLDRQRIVGYALILGILQLAGFAFWLLSARGGIDIYGRPIGTDFTSFWAASHLALSGQPALAYSPEAHRLAELQVFPGSTIDYSGFFYPPAFLLTCLPFAVLPYLWSLLVWLAVTGTAYVAVLRKFLPKLGALDWLLGLSFPAILLNAAHGQNGFLSAAFFGGGILLLDRRPVLAGLVLGCLAFKPQLAVILPFALAMRGDWRTFIAAGSSALILMVVSWLVFGTQTWVAFLDALSLARATLEQGFVEPGKMTSVYAAARVLHASAELAMALQMVAAIAVLVVLWRLAAAKVKPLAFGVAMIPATLLATPFALDYDLTLLAIPLSFVFRRGSSDRFLPYEKIVLFLGFVLPLAGRPMALSLGLPLAPAILAALLGVVVQRSLHDGSERQSVAAPTTAGLPVA